jgi:4'-phosphopantetheinyl transferase EntD
VAQEPQISEFNLITVKSIDATPLLEAWKELLPLHTCVSAGPYPPQSSQPLTQLENASAGLVGPARLHELEAGRFYAKQALSKLGISAPDLPISPSRAPLWPEGTIGSITHVKKRGEGHCAVAVGNTRDTCAIGIDAEYDAGFHPQLWPTVLTAQELEQLRCLPVSSRQTEALTRWCVKEAVTKAAQKRIEPIAIHTEGGLRAGWYVATTSHGKMNWPGRATRKNGFILAAVVMPM